MARVGQGRLIGQLLGWPDEHAWAAPSLGPPLPVGRATRGLGPWPPQTFVVSEKSSGELGEGEPDCDNAL